MPGFSEGFRKEIQETKVTCLLSIALPELFRYFFLAFGVDAKLSGQAHPKRLFASLKVHTG
jgi:hypothetical protein